jgi:hypothetical protein
VKGNCFGHLLFQGACTCIVALTSLLVIDGASGLARAQNTDPQMKERILTALLDNSEPWWRRVLTFDEVSRLPPRSREGVYLRVIRDGDDMISNQAMACAIRDGTYADLIVDAIRARLSASTVASRIGIISPILEAGAPPVLMPILRDGLQLMPKRQPVDKLERETTVLTINDVAVVFANRENNVIDIKLLRDAVESYPEAYIGWLALDRLNAMDDSMCTLARDVYSNAHYGNLARLGAAVASQKKNEDAAAFALDLIRAYLEEYSHPMEELFPGEGARDWRKMDHAQRARLFRMKEEAPAALLLRLVNSDEARKLALEYLDSPNELVADHVQLVAAQKWPADIEESILSVRLSRRADVLAVLAYFHPDLSLPVTRAGVTPGELEAAQQKLAKDISSKPKAYWLLAGL